MSPDLANTILNGIRTTEIGMNIVGYVPVIASCSAKLRNYLARAQVIAAIALSIFALGAYIQGLPIAPMVFVAAKSTASHGILNFVRSFFEECNPLVKPFLIAYDISAFVIFGGTPFPYPTF